jgi:hypothetical protein
LDFAGVSVDIGKSLMDGNSRDIGLLRLLTPVNQLISNVKVVLKASYSSFSRFCPYGFYGPARRIAERRGEFSYQAACFNEEDFSLPYYPNSVNFVVSL